MAFTSAADVLPAVAFAVPPVLLDLSSPDSVPPKPCGVKAKLFNKCAFHVGGYNERRPHLYTSDLFTSSAAVALPLQNATHYKYGGSRTVHVGVDVAAPAGTKVRAPLPGVVVHAGYNGEEGDYGGVIVLEHGEEGGGRFYALYGHLRKRDGKGWSEGDEVARGDEVGRLGKRGENGGWEPHLHLQASVTRPSERDMPGVVREEDVERAIVEFPDPMVLLGL